MFGASVLGVVVSAVEALHIFSKSLFLAEISVIKGLPNGRGFDIFKILYGIMKHKIG